MFSTIFFKKNSFQQNFWGWDERIKNLLILSEKKQSCLKA